MSTDTAQPKPKTAAKQVSDPELKAMAEMIEVMEDLTDPDARRRVINYLAERYDLAAVPVPDAPKVPF